MSEASLVILSPGPDFSILYCNVLNAQPFSVSIHKSWCLARMLKILVLGPNANTPELRDDR